MLIFSKALFVKNQSEKWAERCAEWVDYCDGRIVVNGKIGRWFIAESWCVIL